MDSGECNEYAGITLPEAAKGPEPTAWTRCRTCGVFGLECRQHPSAERIAMTKPLALALKYAHRIHKTETKTETKNGQMQRWIATYDEEYWPGLTRHHAALAWLYLESWGGYLPELAPPSTTPDGSYGS